MISVAITTGLMSGMAASSAMMPSRELSGLTNNFIAKEEMSALLTKHFSDDLDINQFTTQLTDNEFSLSAKYMDQAGATINLPKEIREAIPNYKRYVLANREINEGALAHFKETYESGTQVDRNSSGTDVLTTEENTAKIVRYNKALQSAHGYLSDTPLSTNEQEIFYEATRMRYHDFMKDLKAVVEEDNCTSMFYGRSISRFKIFAL